MTIDTMRALSFSTLFSLLLLSGCDGPPVPERTAWSEEQPFEDKVSLYEDEDRDIWQKPDRVIGLLSPLEGKTVADLGAGTGYFAFRLIPEASKVIAIDIDKDFVEFMNKKKELLPKEEWDKFEVRLATADDPKLRPNEVEALLIVNTYAYLEDRIKYFERLRNKLAPNAKLVIIEFKMKTIPNGPPADEKVPITTVEQELRSAGFRDIKVDDQTLAYQYIITARS